MDIALKFKDEDSVNILSKQHQEDEAIIKAGLISQHRENKEIVRKFVKSFYEVGVALREIRDSRSYKLVEGYKTFAKFCEDEFDMNRRKADRLIIVANVTDNLRLTGLPTPPSGRLCQDLNQFDADEQRQIWVDVCGKDYCDRWLNIKREKLCVCNLTEIVHLEHEDCLPLYRMLIYFSRVLRTIRDYHIYKEYGFETWEAFLDGRYCLTSDKIDQILEWYEEFDDFKGNLFDNW